MLNDDETMTVFAVNRSTDSTLPVEIKVRGFGKDGIVEECITLSHSDSKATNTEENPLNVVPHAGKAVIMDGVVHADLELLSWNVLRIRF